jgi:transposase-like protein
MSEPGEKKPWGSVCPVCGSNDVDVAESKASCNSCGSAFEIEMMLKLISDGTGGMGKKNDDMVEEEAPLGGDTGLGAATAPPAPVAASSYKSMIRLSATVDSDVYLKTALPTFDKTAERMLPIGMVCPSCGNRHAHKVKDNTFCYKCGNYSKTRVAASKTDPTKLDVSITWID